MTEAITIHVSPEVAQAPKDDKFLDLTVSGNANYLISGDDDLLPLKTFENVSIMTVNDYLNLLSHSNFQPK